MPIAWQLKMLQHELCDMGGVRAGSSTLSTYIAIWQVICALTDELDGKLVLLCMAIYASMSPYGNP